MGSATQSGSEGREAAWPFLPVKIEVAQGDETVQGLEYAGERPLLIGRDPACDVVLTIKNASRRHARIVHEGGRLLVRDDGSANGTYVNEARVVEAELHPGDVIRIGGARITLVSGAARAPAAAPSPPPAAPPVGVETPADPAPHPTRLRRRAPAGRGGRRGWLSAAPAAAAFLVVVASACAILFLAAREKQRLKPAAPSTPPAAGAAPAPLAAAAPSDAPVQTIPEAIPVPSIAGEALPPAVTTASGDEDSVIGAIREALANERGSSLGWGIIGQIEEVIQSSPADAPRAELEALAAILKGTRASVEDASRRHAARIIDEMARKGRFGEAAGAARLLARAAPPADASTRSYWEARALEIEEKALAEFRLVEARLSDWNKEGKAAESLRALAGERDRFAGLGFFDGLLPRYIDAVLTPSRRAEETLVTPEALALKSRVGIALDACRYSELESLYQALLALDPPIGERLRLLEALVESFYLDRMLEDLFASLAQKPIETSLLQGYQGRVLRADQNELEYELDVEGRKGAYKGAQSWPRLSRATKISLFDAATLSPDGLLGLSFLCRYAGDEEGTQKTLLRLWRRKGSQEIAGAVLARHLGIPPPGGGFVEFEGRLVTGEARAAELERRRRAAEEDKAARAELARLKRDSRLSRFLDVARKLRKEGSFTLAQALLGEIARRFPNASEGKAASAMLEDPILQVHTLLESGPSRNRLELLILGDGYPAEDDYQAAFLVSANVAMKLLLKEEPFKEYASYLNVRAAQLASKDRGLDRLPGGTDKDTACGGKVEWDVFTADRSRVRGILKRMGKEFERAQAIVIGNDSAGVSTGGGAVSCVAKGSLNALAHEVGHALGGLRDEYDYEPGTNPARSAAKKREAEVPVKDLPPNLMAGSDREKVLESVSWKRWIDAGESRWWNGSKVSVFEGGDHTPFGVWRPQASCKMRDSTAFCVVCMEVMVKKLYAHVRPIDRVEPEGDEIVLPSGDEREVRVWPLKPATRFLEASWSLLQLPDEEQPKKGPTVVVTKHTEQIFKTAYRRMDPDGRPVEAALLRARDFAGGKRFRLRVEVRDPTPWVLEDGEGLLAQSREWVVKIVSGAGK
jgi:hypothetical protein